MKAMVPSVDETAVDLLQQETESSREWVENYWNTIQDAAHIPHDAPITCDACVREEYVQKATYFHDGHAAGFAEAVEMLTDDAAIERAARALDPLGWSWCDRAEDTHPARPIFIERSLKAMRTAAAALAQTGPQGEREATPSGRSDPTA